MECAELTLRALDWSNGYHLFLMKLPVRIAEQLRKALAPIFSTAVARRECSNHMEGNYKLVGKEVVPCASIDEWSTEFKKDRTVAKNTVGGSFVSTVFLATDDSFGGSRPLLFETVVFGGPLEGEQERYSTWDEAERGHQAMVARVKKEEGVD